MPFKSIRVLPDERIVLLEFEGFISVEDIVAARTAALPMIANTETNNEAVCLIIDASNTTSSFSEILRILWNTTVNNIRADFKFEFRVMFVGTHGLVKFYADNAHLKQFG